MSQRVAVVGSRPPRDDFGWGRRVSHRILDRLAREPVGTVIISGGAAGVDTLAMDAARAFDLETVEYLADWNRYGKRAGALRNQQIVDDCDRVIAFWDGQSKGTKITIDMARRAGKPVEIVRL